MPSSPASSVAFPKSVATSLTASSSFTSSGADGAALGSFLAKADFLAKGLGVVLDGGGPWGVVCCSVSATSGLNACLTEVNHSRRLVSSSVVVEVGEQPVVVGLQLPVQFLELVGLQVPLHVVEAQGLTYLFAWLVDHVVVGRDQPPRARLRDDELRLLHMSLLTVLSGRKRTPCAAKANRTRHDGCIVQAAVVHTVAESHYSPPQRAGQGPVASRSRRRAARAAG